MSDLIGRLLTWVGLFPRPRGRHRASALSQRLAPTAPPPALDASLPAHRSPYGLDTPMDGAATIAVRPYVAAHEQWQRHREVVMAAMGFDVPGPYWIRETEVA
ncbi:hypothetical protein OG889_24750 [Streptomyces sp. NBC_00481]|uniref:hypothetical protein n=1 Tax=Streptomyces sp. NBC_00481 TaxID=2975755 RepID=UPI002DDB162C|nr:hypothetical protein [Streptomyces sp. NBC_00481]WRY97635.1 hypothetical protein OG889_24750 [Streptomyces sp. NBC_00481]